MAEVPACRACSRREGAAGVLSGLPDRTPAGREDRSVTLLLRVWPEGDELRCRMLSTADTSSAPRPIAVTQGVDAICAEVRAWLLAI